MKFKGSINERKVKKLKEFGFVFIHKSIKSRLSRIAFQLVVDEDELKAKEERINYLESLVKELEDKLIDIDRRLNN